MATVERLQDRDIESFVRKLLSCLECEIMGLLRRGRPHIYDKDKEHKMRGHVTESGFVFHPQELIQTNADISMALVGRLNTFQRVSLYRFK